MIISCPQCDTRFVVPSTIFTDGGRKVRCASCKHEWVQEPERDNDAPVYIDTGEREDDFARHLSTSMESQPEISNSNTTLLEKLKSDFTTGLKVIIAACVTVLFIYFLYGFLTPSIIQGDGLAFNDLAIIREGERLLLTGEIVNTVSKQRGVPSLKITALMQDDIEGDIKLIAPEKIILESGEILPVSVLLDSIGPEIQNIKITFDGVSTTPDFDNQVTDSVNDTP